MEKLTASQVLAQGADIKAFKLKDSGSIKKAIEQTIQMQAAVLKMKDVDQDRLRMVVQL
jgi:hypothetical protein